MVVKNRNKHKGVVLIMVLGMLMLMSIVVSLFLNDIMEEAYLRIQLSGKVHLRHQAYNALNYVISYVEQCTTNSLRIDFSKEGNREIKLKGFEGIKTYVQLNDESGKIPLNKAKANQRELKPLFYLFGDIWDGQMLMQSYLNWSHRKSVESQLIEQDGWSSNSKQKTLQKQRNNLTKIVFPCNLNTYAQLKEIDKFREMFFDKKGEPNEKMERLKKCSSLYNVGKVNINSVNKDVLEVLSKNFSLDLDQMENYLGLSEYSKSEPKFYKSLKEINTLGHGNLSFTTKTGRDMQQIDCRNTLAVEPSVVSVMITVQEADTSFVLKAILFCDQPHLTKSKKNANIPLGGVVRLKRLVENCLL